MRAFLIAAFFLATPVAAQDRAATLADIRQELTVLWVEVQRLKRELSTTGGANVNTLAAFQAPIEMNIRKIFFIVEYDRPLLAHLHAGAATGAVLLGNFGKTGSDNTDIFYLRLRAGIGTICKRHSEFVMKFKIFFYLLL